jgi:hypothetical protein
MEEKDPNGKEAKEPGAKLDAGKVRANLVLRDFAGALMAVAKVGTFGANKYSDSGWINVPDGYDRYSDAMVRHYLMEEREACDKDSELWHQAHLAWNALARLELLIRAEEMRKGPAGYNTVPTESFINRTT